MILMETGHLTDEAAYISMQHHERLTARGIRPDCLHSSLCLEYAPLRHLRRSDITSSVQEGFKGIRRFELMKRRFDPVRQPSDKYLITMLGPKNSPAYVEH